MLVHKKRIISILLTLVMVFSMTVTANADTDLNISNQYDNSRLIKQMEQGNFIYNDNVKTRKMSIEEKQEYLANSENVDIANTNVYVIEKSLSENTGEINVITDLVVKTENNSTPINPGITPLGEVSDTGSSAHVIITSIIGFDKITRSNIVYKRGTYYGGYVNEKPSTSSISSITGTYGDVGAYIEADGKGGIQSSRYLKTTNFSTSNPYSRKTASISRNRYFSTDAPLTMLGSIFTVKGNINTTSASNPYTVNAYAYAIFNGVSF